jgi:hypothetical protein
MAEVYRDSLVVMTEDGIVVRRYSSFGGDKRVAWDDVDHVRALTPTLRNGKWRLWGSGDFRTWFGCDLHRPLRQTIFIMRLRSQWMRVGFTVEDAATVKQLLAQRGILIDEQGVTPPRPSSTALLPRPPALWRSPALWLMLTLVVATVALCIYFHPALPEHAATRFGWDGSAVGWGPRSLLTGAILFGAGALAATFGLLAWGTSRHSASAAELGRMMLWLGNLSLSLLLVMAYLSLRANLSTQQTMGYAPLYAIAAWLAAVCGWAVLLIRRAARLPAAR